MVLLQLRFEPLLSELAPALGHSRLEYAPGWRREDMSLADALLLTRDRDLSAGYTSVGPHRADWRIGYAAFPGREALSRGQAKLTALAILLAQAGLHAGLRGEWPIIALDDLASACCALVEKNGLEACYLRPMVMRGYGAASMVPFASPVEVFLPCWPWGAYLGEGALEKGVDVCVSSWTRIAPNTLPAMAKAGANYMNSQLMKMEAIKDGYAEGIALDAEGFLSEGTSPVSTQISATGSHFTGKRGLMPEPRVRPTLKSGYGSHFVASGFPAVAQLTTGQMPLTMYSAVHPFSV
jgi:hypothetical protein